MQNQEAGTLLTLTLQYIHVLLESNRHECPLSDVDSPLEVLLCLTNTHNTIQQQLTTCML